MEIINNLIYFNNNGTTHMDERVERAMHEAKHPDVAEARTNAALSISKMIHCKPSEVFFTAGTTPSIHIGIETIFDVYKHKGNHIISSVIEHGEVLKALEALKNKGAEITYLPVNKEGLIDPEELENAIKPATIFVSIMAANNHTGVIQPMEKMGAVCANRNILFFSDACQFVGKMRCDVEEWCIDCVAFGSHKMYGPRGIGALYVKENTALYNAMAEKQKNAEPEDAALYAGFAKAAAIFEEDHWETSAHISKLKNYVEHQLLDIEGFRINGSTRYRLYNTSNLLFPATVNIRALEDRFKFLSYTNDFNYVLKAMGLSDAETENSFRFSFGKNNTLDEAKLLVEEINKL